MNTERIVVLGGSFNPPTLAHFRLMQSALDGLQAQLGYYVPSSHGYVRRKMKRTPHPDGTQDISSTAVRSLLRAGEDPADLLHPAAAVPLIEYIKEHPMFTINKFREQYGFLSNFHEAPVTWEGLTYPNAEAAFQATKVLTSEERLPFTTLPANRAKRVGRQVQLRPDWEEVKTGLMEEIVRAKFTQNPALAAQLLSTGNAQLMEGNNWGDTCWGVDMRTGKGENRLGCILMKVRAKLAGNEGGDEV